MRPWRAALLLRVAVSKSWIDPMRICIIYDCLFPLTVGGAERWYRDLAEAYAADGHQVTYLTMRQWPGEEPPHLAGVEVVAVAPRMALYDGEKRRFLPPFLFGLGVLMHLIRRGSRYDVVHTCSFPFFSLLAAGLVRPFARYRIVVDWFEVWSRDYWRAYIGRFGVIGWAVQRLCATVPQMAFSFSRLHAARAIALGVGGGNVELLEGLYAGASLIQARPAAEPAEIVYAGRMIPEKQVPLLVDALAIVMAENSELRATLIGRGPEQAIVASRIAAHGLGERIALPGFVAEEALEDALGRAALIVQPSTREGYGLVVVESSARGVPVIVIRSEDNAASELVETGENGFIVESADPIALADAIRLGLSSGRALRGRTARWYAVNRERLSFAASFRKILERVGPY